MNTPEQDAETLIVYFQTWNVRGMIPYVDSLFAALEDARADLDLANARVAEEQRTVLNLINARETYRKLWVEAEDERDALEDERNALIARVAVLREGLAQIYDQSFRLEEDSSPSAKLWEIRKDAIALLASPDDAAQRLLAARDAALRLSIVLNEGGNGEGWTMKEAIEGLDDALAPGGEPKEGECTDPGCPDHDVEARQ